MEELKKTCEAFRAELNAVLPELEENGVIRDYRSGELLKTLHRTINDVNSVINTITAYYQH